MLITHFKHFLLIYYSFLYIKSIHFQKGEKAWNRMEILNTYIYYLEAVQTMWEYPVYPINFLSKIAEIPHFQCNSESRI